MHTNNKWWLARCRLIKVVAFRRCARTKFVQRNTPKTATDCLDGWNGCDCINLCQKTSVLCDFTRLGGFCLLVTVLQKKKQRREEGCAIKKVIREVPNKANVRLRGSRMLESCLSMLLEPIFLAKMMAWCVDYDCHTTCQCATNGDTEQYLQLCVLHFQGVR